MEKTSRQNKLEDRSLVLKDQPYIYYWSGMAKDIGQYI